MADTQDQNKLLQEKGSQFAILKLSEAFISKLLVSHIKSYYADVASLSNWSLPLWGPLNIADKNAVDLIGSNGIKP
jgi:hypothetical protein